ncbi:MAG: PEP-CTERM sorting domain-containing protein [Planctomycetota bacterium]|nr:PEP-CTERM sorting domain-containing protein [Planctomycetota bacterium]
MADYTGPATKDVELPVGEAFAFELQLTASGNGNSPFVSSGNSPQYGITIPTGYAFTPEPATLSLLALGGLALLHRRRSA